MAEFESDLEAAGKLFKKVKASAHVGKSRREKRRRQPKVLSEAEKDRQRQTDRIIGEMKGLGIGASELVIPFRDPDSGDWSFVEPIRPFPLAREHRWTAELPMFEKAKQSSIDAILKLVAQTGALQCSGDVQSETIEQTLFKIRAGLIKENDSAIPQLVAYAQKIGLGRSIAGRIDDALHDAERRKNDGTPLPDLNQFRLRLALCWTGFLFWLMSDDNIAAFIAANNLVPGPLIVNPSTVTKARRELGLIKSDRLLVKAVGRKFHWTFIEGYPPSGE